MGIAGSIQDLCVMSGIENNTVMEMELDVELTWGEGFHNLPRLNVTNFVNPQRFTKKSTKIYNKK